MTSDLSEFIYDHYYDQYLDRQIEYLEFFERVYLISEISALKKFGLMSLVYVVFLATLNKYGLKSYNYLIQVYDNHIVFFGYCDAIIGQSIHIDLQNSIQYIDTVIIPASSDLMGCDSEISVSFKFLSNNIN